MHGLLQCASNLSSRNKQNLNWFLQLQESLALHQSFSSQGYP